MTDFFITFRETLEAALVVGIVLSYLNKLELKKWFKVVYAAIAAGLAGSIILAYIFEKYFGGFKGTSEEIYEGVIMFIAAALITWMIVWMLKQRHLISHNLRAKMDKHVESNNKAGIFILVLAAVLREGIETFLFLKASALRGGGNNLLLSIAGIVAAIALGYILFSGLKKINLKPFFTVSTIILLLFAAGLFAHSIHEFQEAHVINFLTQEAWNVTNITILSKEHPLGEFLRSIFGWNANPSILEVIGYFGYLFSVILFTKFYSFEKTKK